ncbi:MAG: CRISPR-associated endonuclease Cas2 [Candidatus Terrybacteria bacterium]|nr:CRISPR-associated endonuclease Cas2 [Candidatus Terrybacteria bacterium]
MSRGLGDTQKKILLLLMAGLALGLSHSPKTSFRVIKGLKEEWKNIDRQALRRAIKKLYESKLVKEKENSDGTVTLFLTDKGKQKALTYNLDEMKIKKPEQWDGKWRIVLFDIPKNGKKIREALRNHLNNLGFYQFQKSVFAHPYDCQDEIEYIIEVYDIRKFVRFMVAESIDNELHLKHHFELE